MHILWKRKTHATNRQMGEPICPHSNILRPVTLTPIMNLYVQGEKKYKSVWRIAPGIRRCCLKNGLAQAAWWWEVDQRFEDLRREGLDDEVLANSLLENRQTIEALLELVVPRPLAQDRRRFERLRQEAQQPRRVKVRLPGFAKVLGIPWPCSEDDLKTIWRQLALQHHPDRGGSAEEFIRFKQAYETARERVQNG